MYNLRNALLTEPERRFLTAVAGLAYSNPFLPERTGYQRTALGRDFVPRSLVWSACARLDPVIENVSSLIAGIANAHPDELPIYEDSAQYLISKRCYPDFAAPKPDLAFLRPLRRRSLPTIFAPMDVRCIRNCRFPHTDHRPFRYRQGTVANSRYVAFDPARYAFAGAALSPTPIESELFGRKLGSFTGAAGDRKGCLDSCPPTESIFRDELSELDLAIQVKLLRVIERRCFSASATRRFASSRVNSLPQLIAICPLKFVREDSGKICIIAFARTR